MFYPLLPQHHHHRGADNEDCKIKACPPDQWNNPGAQNEDREILIRWELEKSRGDAVVVSGIGIGGVGREQGVEGEGWWLFQIYRREHQRVELAINDAAQFIIAEAIQ